MFGFESQWHGQSGSALSTESMGIALNGIPSLEIAALSRSWYQAVIRLSLRLRF